MIINEQIRDILDRARSLMDQGLPISAVDLCRETPELLEEVQRHLEDLGRGESMSPTRPLAPQTTPPPSSSGPGRIAPPSEEPPPGPMRYHPLRLHARGGLGEIFVAEDVELHREVALKRLPDKRLHDAESRRRLLSEAEITGKLEHPGVVPVYGLTQDSEGRICYAMRFVQGETLEQATRQFHKAHPSGASRYGSLAFRQLLNRFVVACNTVAYAHSRGILHRDLKPSNIMLGKFGETLVVDWGLAKPFSDLHVSSSAPSLGSTPEPAAISSEGLQLSSVDTDLTQAGRAVGTPSYMSPEQARGDRSAMGPPSDIYSLGATLYAMLTGQPPISGPDALERVRHGRFPPPRQIKKEIPRPLEAICLKAMSLEPADRYGSALDLAADLERWLADEPVQARAEPWRERLRRWASRHRALVGSAALVSVLTATILGVAAVYLNAAWQREVEAHELADENARQANAARQREAEARGRADENARLAREAVDSYFVDVSEDLRLTQHGMGPLRKKLLDNAREYYEQFVADHGNDPSLRKELGRAYWRLAYITGETESWAKALPLYERAAACFKELRIDEPANAEYRSLLARIYNDRGYAQMQLSQSPAAEVSFQQARKLFEELVAEAPTDPARLRGRAAVLENLALLFRATDRRGEAEAIYQTLLPLRERLARESSGQAQLQRELARTLHNLALFHRSGRKPDEARAPLERAVGLRRELARTHPQIDKYQDELAGTLNELALVHLERGRFPQAVEAVQQAIAIWERLAGLYPDVLEYQTGLLDALDKLGALQGRMGKSAEGAQTFHNVITRLGKLVAEHPELPGLATRLGGSYCNLANHVKDHGKPKDALADFDRAEQSLRAVLDKDQNSRQAREFLRNTHWGRAEAFTLLQRHKEALTEWDKALELAGDESRAELSLCRAGTLVRMGDHRRGVGVVSTMGGSESLPGALLYNSACVYALAAAMAQKDTDLAASERDKLVEEYARQAVARLGQAHKQRIFQSQVMREQLRQDPDLAAVRPREDFKQLLAAIEKK